MNSNRWIVNVKVREKTRIYELWQSLPLKGTSSRSSANVGLWSVIKVKIHETKWPVDVFSGGGSRGDEKYKRSDNEGIHTHNETFGNWVEDSIQTEFYYNHSQYCKIHFWVRHRWSAYISLSRVEYRWPVYIPPRFYEFWNTQLSYTKTMSFINTKAF